MTTIIVAVVAVVATLLIAVPITSKVSVDNKVKKDAETGKPLEGVVFGLYAQENIKNAAGEVVVEKDALIELGTTDEKGKLVFQADLPHGKYYIQEVEHKPGYLPNDEVYSFDASYTDQTLELLAFSEEISEIVFPR